MTDIFGQLDDIDRKAMREGSAISRLNEHLGKRRSPIIVKKIHRKGVKKGEEIDILRILNIIQGK